MEDLGVVFSVTIIVGVVLGLTLGRHLEGGELRLDAVEHGYGQWCPDRSFAWQHEECE